MRTLVVGLGWVAREVWIPRLLAHPKFELSGLVDVDPDAIAHAPSGQRIDVPVYADFRDVPTDDIDIAFVLTPNHTHSAIAEWFLRRGRAVFLEKPACTSAEELDAVVAAAAADGGWLALSSAARYRADVGALRSLVTDGVLGEARLAEATWVRAHGIPSSGWFTRRAAAGGGVLLDLGWHLVDVVHDLWPGTPVTAAAGVATSDFLAEGGGTASWHGAAGPRNPAGHNGSTVEVEDQFTGFVATERYGLSLRVAWASHEQIDTTVLTLYGSRGTAQLQTTFGFSPHRSFNPRLELRHDGTVEPVALPAEPIGTEYDRQLDSVARHFRDPDAGHRALDSMRWSYQVTSALYQAAGRP